MAEPDPGRGRCAGRIRRARRDFGRPKEEGVTVSARQLKGNSANIGLVGCGDPVPGSTVNASAAEAPRFVKVAVVECATAAVPTVPADCGPFAPINHI